MDVLQLAQTSQEMTFRVVNSDVRGGLDASGYRPWRATLNVDLYRRKPEEGCAAPTRSTASKTLFDPKIKASARPRTKASKKH